VRGPIELTRVGVITEFVPTRGEGAFYRLGETISFRVVTTRSGYLTLTSFNSDGTVDVFDRNVYVRAGENVIPRTGTYRVAPPRGLQRVRASFTPTQTDAERVVYVGRRGEGVWTEMIETELEPFPEEARDVAETSFFIR